MLDSKPILKRIEYICDDKTQSYRNVHCCMSLVVQARKSKSVIVYATDTGCNGRNRACQFVFRYLRIAQITSSMTVIRLKITSQSIAPNDGR
jgi:hypothetical protein